MSSNAGHKPKVLIVDDKGFNISLLTSLLRDQYRLMVATSGREALRAAAVVPPPELILLDVLMPDIDGFEVCRQLKQDPLTQAIPVVFCSSLDGNEDRAKGLAAGAVDFIHKPFVSADVLACLRRHLGVRPAAVSAVAGR